MAETNPNTAVRVVEIGDGWDANCMFWRGEVLTGAKAHWCWDYDGLPVDETCPEWPCGCVIED